MVAVNTTAGTAAEITRFCIITDDQRKVKMALVDWRLTPTLAVNDPNLMVGMPKGLTAATGMDALTHAIEAYVSTASNPITDANAIHAMKLIATYLPQAVEDGKNMKARDMMAYAEFLAGMAFNSASLGYVHAMAHQLGGSTTLRTASATRCCSRWCRRTTPSTCRSSSSTLRMRWASRRSAKTVRRPSRLCCSPSGP